MEFGWSYNSFISFFGPVFLSRQVLDYPLQQGRCLVGPLDRKSLAIRFNCTDWIPWLRKSSSWSGGRTKQGVTRNLVSLGHENETEALFCFL